MIKKIWNAIAGRKTRGEAVEITYETLRQQIRELAYKKWEEAGGPWGRDKEFWIEAEQELFGENPLSLGGYRVKSDSGLCKVICPINSEIPVEFAALGDPAARETAIV